MQAPMKTDFKDLRQKLVLAVTKEALRRGMRDHHVDDAVQHALARALTDGSDLRLEVLTTFAASYLRSLRPDARRPSTITESQLRREGDRFDPGEAPSSALDRVATEATALQCAAPKPEPLPREQRKACSKIRAALETELQSFWLPQGRKPNWKSWARRVSEASGRAVDVDQVAEAMASPKAVAPRGRRAQRSFACAVDGSALPDRELAKRRAGALFTLCGVALADTQELDKRAATDQTRARDKFKSTTEGRAVWTSEGPVQGPPQEPRPLPTEGCSGLAPTYFKNRSGGGSTASARGLAQ